MIYQIINQLSNTSNNTVDIHTILEGVTEWVFSSKILTQGAKFLESSGLTEKWVSMKGTTLKQELH